MKLMCAGRGPCGNFMCSREECQPGYVASPVMDDFDLFLAGGTKQGTKNGSTGSESVPQTTSEGEPLYTLHSLTGADVARLEQALKMLRRIYTRDSEGYRAVSELGARVSALNWTE